MLVLQTNLIEPLAHISIAEVVDQVAVQDSCVPHGTSLAVVVVRSCRRIAGKFRPKRSQARYPVVLEVAAHKQAVIAILCKVVINFTDVCIALRRRRCTESKTSEVKAVPGNVSIWQRILIENLHHCRIRAGTQRAGPSGSKSRC